MWSYDPGSGDWKKLNSAGDVPPALYWAALAYDPSAEGFALFGGQGSTSSFSDATCAYTPATGQWARLAAPSSVEVLGAWSYAPSPTGVGVASARRSRAKRAEGTARSTTSAAAAATTAA